MTRSLFQHDTIAAVATPPGEGGVAVVRISGPEALAVADRCFRPRRGRRLRQAGGYTVHYGRFVDEQENLLDDGLATVFRAPRSYTGEESVEFSCHGGRANTARILRRVLEAGARLAEPGEFTQRAFFNGRIDLAQAEATADLIRANSETARRAALRQLHGELSRRLAEIKDELVGILAAIEVTIDFSDEVGDLEHGPILARIQTALSDLEALLATADRGRILREGLRVAIIGRPNVGKSSLLNALLQTERAIVTPIAGTTRDLLEEQAHLSGAAFVLVDTAGIRETHDPVERIGVERAKSAAAEADLVLLVLEAGQSDRSQDQAVLQDQPDAETAPRIAALNKCDLLDEKGIEADREEIENRLPSLRSVVPISAKTGRGLPQLEEAMLAAVGLEQGVETAGAVTVIAERHREALTDARNSLIEAERTATLRMPGDFIAIDLRGALDAIGRITGETAADKIIHRIFRDFCVGK